MSGPVTTVFSGGGTGGHLYPALALAGALEDRRPDVRTCFVGAQGRIEARVLPERGLEHVLVRIEGLRRDSLFANVRVLGLLVKAVARVVETFQRIRPELVVVTGGYASGPAGLAAVLTRTRLVLQEQNSLPGVTTRLLAPFAREVHVAFPESVEALPRRARGRARVSGNPVRPPEPTDRVEAAGTFGLDPSRRTVLVVGGSQGARALNEAMLQAVSAVVRGESPPIDGAQILWATGPANLEAVNAALDASGRPGWVHVLGYIDRMPAALSLADLAVSRAGAMATSEFLAWGIPAVLVPLPTAAADHQSRNAEALSHAGAAVHLAEADASGEALWAIVRRLLTDSGSLDAMATAAKARGRPHAAREIAESLDRLLPPVRRVAA